MIQCLSAFVLLLLLSCVIGRLVQQIIHRRESTKRATGAGAFLAGSFVLLALFTILHIIAVAAGLAFGLLKWGYVTAVLALTVLSLLICGKKLLILPQQPEGKGLEKGIYVAIPVLLVLLVISIELYEPYFGSDMTVESAVTTLETETIYEYHPATGVQLEEEMNLLAKLDPLPVFYAVLGAVTGADLRMLICDFIPVWFLLINVAAVQLLLSSLLRKKSICRRALFFYLVLLLVGDYQSFTNAFRLLHQGFSTANFCCGTVSVVILAGALNLISHLGNRAKSLSADERRER